MKTKYDNFYSVEEAAVLLSLNRNTVYRACHDGKMPAIKFGNQYRFRKADIDALVGKVDALPVQRKTIINSVQVFRGRESVIIKAGDVSLELSNAAAAELFANLSSRSMIKKSLTQEEKNSVLRLYQETREPLASIGARFGVSRQAIQNIINKAGVGGARCPEQSERILKLHADGRMGRRHRSG